MTRSLGRRNQPEGAFKDIERWEPHLRALVGFDEPAARRRAAQSAEGPLAGWSVGVKDIIDWAGAPTRCNAPFIPAEPCRRDSAIVAALIERGAFVLAKTVTTTFAYFDPGPTRNPWNLDHTPGGSSSGSAAAVAAGFVRLALGTQTIGSINRPAAFCGVVGFKPTNGRLPLGGVFPFAPSVDTLGFFTAHVGDAQLAFTALVDGHAVAAPDSLRIGVVKDLMCPPAEQTMLEAVHTVARKLDESGHHTHAAQLPPLVEAAYENHQVLIAMEGAQSHQTLFARYGDQYTPKLRQLIQKGRQIPSARLKDIEAHQLATCAEIDALLETFDLLLTPSAPGPAPAGVSSTGDPRMNLIWTYGGFPTLTLPACLTGAGLPLGIQLVGRRMEDQRLLAAGIEIEKRLAFTAKPKPPRMTQGSSVESVGS